MKNILIFLSLSIFSHTAFAENGESFMRSNEKIYVAVAVLLVILLGVLFFLFGIEKRLKKLENKQSYLKV